MLQIHVKAFRSVHLQYLHRSSNSPWHDSVLSRYLESRRAQPAGRPADRSARPGAGQPGRVAQVAPVGLRRRVRRPPRVCLGRRSQAHRLAAVLHPRLASSSSSTRWRRTSSAISCSTPAPRCATAKAPQQKLAYAAQMVAALGHADRPPGRQDLAGHLRREGAGHGAAQQLDGPDHPHGRAARRARAGRARRRWPLA